ncbi:unnamed protein product [Meganyctiphanes norvegica]|uniref:C-type lectin domain-containing protein n=1 Tax=Meganyctiphanes norvegica TaxID=48144 RepID=A0AAV2S6Q4_MEGNR
MAGICYYFTDPSSGAGVTTWDFASTTCKNMATNELLGRKVGLAELGLAETWKSEKLMLQKITDRNVSHWLGATDKANHGHWIWETSQRQLSLQDSYWKVGDPNSGGSEHCLLGVVHTNTIQNIKTKRTYLGDFPCNDVHNSKRPYVCQIF